MKKITLLLLLPFILITASRGQDGTDASKTMNDLKKQLPADPVYTGLLKNGWTFLDKAGKGLKPGIRIETNDPSKPGVVDQLKAVNPADIATIKSILSAAFENADELFDIITRNQEQLKEFKSKFPSLYSLKTEEISSVLSTAAETYYGMELESGLLAPGGISTGPDGGPCEERRDADKARCVRNARLESAACSLTTSTFIGSLICGAVVLLHERNCKGQADIDYLYCVTRSN